MNGSLKFIKALILLGIFLGGVGLLEHFTLEFGKKAIEAQKKDGIKFKKLNSSLIN